MSKTDKELIDHLFTYHQPADDEMHARLDAVRAKFKTLAKFIAKSTPEGADREAALYALADASRATIFAIVANQEPDPEPEVPADDG